jgi:2-isopropylmalate synthase
VRFARNLVDDIEFSPEDGYRSNMDFLCRVLEAVIKEGATTLNIPDTVGYAIPELYGEFIRTLRERIPNSDKAIWSVHCHNDLGMAVANSLAGVKIGGARQVECTINGLGERAGNCSLEEVVMAVRFARNLCDDIEFSPEDGYRSDPDFLCRVLEAVIAEGATTINIPDTVGYAIPELYGEFIRNLRERIPNADKAVWSVHCHNDLGMAVANSLAGVKLGGARQVECTINGLGERAGNCSLEEVVMAVRTRRDYFGLQVGVDASQIVPASRLVAQTTGFVVQPNKAVVGANAFAHASGIHQDGVLKARDTYEIMRAEDVGWSANKIVLGKLSGRNAFKQRLQELGIALESEGEINAAFARFKDLADRKSEIFDEDIIALVSDESVTPAQEHYRLLALRQQSETGERPQATVVFTAGDKEWRAEAAGNGPVDASLKAIESKLQTGAEMLLYSVNAITSGSTESQGEVTVRLQHGGRVVNGVGADPDIVVASAKAYLSALNKLHSSAERVAAQG